MIRTLAATVFTCAVLSGAALAQDTQIEVNPPAQGPWTAPQVCFLDGKAFSINAQVCNTGRGTKGNRLLECKEGKDGRPVKWDVMGNVC